MSKQQKQSIRKYVTVFLLAIPFLWMGSVFAQTPAASFSSSVLVGCSPLQVSFTNTSTGANSYSWNFGNSNTSTLTNPSTFFLVPDTYVVALTATNTISGLQSTTNTTIIVVPDPIADFTASPLNGCEDVVNICFTNNSQYAASYTWDFGDGTSSTLVSPCHTYMSPGTFTVKLIASSSYGCVGIKTRTNYATIYSKPSAAFNANNTSSCNPSDIFNFSSTGVGITSWNWNFGDGNTSTLQNPSHSYGVSGAFTVSLIVTNANGCIDTLVKTNYINIGASLVPSITMSDTSGCAPLSINFNCTVPNATSWGWTFGNGNSSIQQSPSITYTNSGMYTVSLFVTTQSGCNGNITLTNFVTVDTLPTVAFSAIQDTGCAAYNAQFVNNTTGAVSYLWEFGDGSTSTAANPSHNYNNGGTYTVTLHAYSQNGCESILTQNNFIVVLEPKANFSGTPLSGCIGMTTAFSTSLPQFGNISWQWSFGDGTFSALQNPTHTYNSIGSYTVWLIVTNYFGCKDTAYKSNFVNVVPGNVPYVLPDTIKVCQNSPTVFVDPKIGNNNWLWNFGNGGTANTQNPSYIYSTLGIYTVTLFSSMPGGCSQTYNPFAIVEVIPYTPLPIVSTIISTCKPYIVSFNTATLNIVNYQWDFGDGTTSLLAAPTHTYDTAGVYVVTLNITVGNGCQSSLSTTVMLGHSNPMQINSNNVCKGSASQFTLLSPAVFTSVLWNFGNGTTSSLFNPTHTYSTIGSFTPTLITTDVLGCVDTFSLTPVIVNNPVANFSVVGNTTGCLSLPVQFNNTSTNASSYRWDFGDGNTSTLTSPSHTYTTAGVYTVSLTAYENGCSKILVKNNLIIIVSPTCNFMFNSSDMCLPVTVTYTDLSPNAVSWYWEFGDGTTSTLQNPVHTFNSSPSGSVSLTITDSYGCTKKRTKSNINYYAASATVSAPSGCAPFNVQFADQSLLAVSWLWDFGDGSTSTIQNPTHTYLLDGVYNVTLIATFPGSCIDTIVYPALITVQTPHADFFAPSVSGCSPIQLSFSNLSTDAVTYMWDFGDGGISTNVNPTHIYNIPGLYDIKLIATNSAGCADTMIKTSYIVIPGTYSNFSISAASGCESLIAIFTDSSINATTWSWNFGDGFTDSISNPMHTYQDTGSFVVTLITQDTLGCVSSFTFPVPVDIHPDPVAMAVTADTAGCSSHSATFINQSTFAHGYHWLFGDGDTSSIANPTHMYQTAGIYNPVLIATTQYGCMDTFQFSQTINVKQTPTASFATSDTIGCEPATISFTNGSTQTINPNFAWNFGNAQTSTLQNVTNLFSTANSYSVSLITTNNNGCRDTATQQILINPSPIASATTNDWEGCQTYTTQFINSSTGYTNQTWLFGNGDLSPVNAPSYNYLLPGSFYPSLIVTNNFGCADTFNFASPIIVHATPIANFNVNASTLCTPGNVIMANTSFNLANPSYNWNYGDGTFATIQNGLVTYSDSGTFNVVLTVTNTFGCSDSISQTITVNHSPVAAASTMDTTGCSPYSSQFSNATTYADSYLWMFGDGDTSSASSPIHTYLTGGNYYPILIAFNSFGCSDTFYFSQPIVVNQTPSVSFNSNAINGCINTSFQFNDQSTFLQAPVFNWDFTFTNSSLQNPLITYTNPGFYNVALTVTNSNGCSSTLTMPTYIEIFDTIPPSADPILSVSVIDDSNLEVKWSNSSFNDLGQYVLYRFNTMTNVYDLIYTDNSPQHSSVAPTSSYIDSNLNTKDSTYTYLLQTVDRCNFKLPLISLIAHTSMNVTALQAGVDIQVNWTPYLGGTVSGYTITRTEVANGSSAIVSTVNASTFSYLDTSLYCPFPYSYRITANDINGNAYLSLSDTSNATPLDLLAGQHVDVVRSTVIFNKYVLTEWLPPTLLPNRVAYYDILRSTDSVNYSSVGTAPALATSYTDNNVKVNDQNYYYKVIVVNDCSLQGPQSGEGTSILLNGEWRNFKTHLNWTKYKAWNLGVDNYTIEKLNDSGIWEFVKSVDGNTTNSEIDD